MHCKRNELTWHASIALHTLSVSYLHLYCPHYAMLVHHHISEFYKDSSYLLGRSRALVNEREMIRV